MSSHELQRTFLKVFVEVPDDDKSDDNFSNSPAPSSSSSRKGTSYLCKGSSSAQSQYCTITISPTSTAHDVCNAVARKRNLLFNEDEYQLVMCDGDGKASYETILTQQDQPHQFQQSAAKHGHLGDFHFVFRKADLDETDIDEDSDGDSEPDIFGYGTMPQKIKHGKYPAAWMEKRGKNHKAWRRRYFVLVENELLYYKRRDVYEHNKEPIARIQLVNPPGIIKILPPETIRKNQSVITLFLFDIHTPKRIYSLRIDNYNDLLFWVKALSRRNEANELIDGCDTLISSSESLHSNDDEDIMERFSSLQSVLNDKDATDALMKYLQSIHNEEFIHFWLDLNKYLSDFVSIDCEKQKRFAIEIYEKYIKSGAKYQLSEIKSKHRSNLKKQIAANVITVSMFDDIKQSVFDYLNRDSYKFFNSSEYFRFIVTYKLKDNVDKYSWPQQFENDIAIASTTCHNAYINNKFIKSVHSPVLRNRPQSPLHHRSFINGKTNHSFHAKSWTNVNPYDFANKNNGKVEVKKYTKKSKKHTYSKSIFDNAPGISNSSK